MFSVATTVFGIITTLCMLYIAFRVYRKAPPWVDDKIENVMAVFLKPDEEGRNLVDQLADRFGKGFRMSLLAQKSGDVRHMKAIEGRVFEAVKENVPEIKVGLKLAEKFGLGDLVESPEDAFAVMQVLQKYGINVGDFLKPGTGAHNSPGEGYGSKM